jgi:Tol biopolymer transport system component
MTPRGTFGQVGRVAALVAAGFLVVGCSGGGSSSPDGGGGGGVTDGGADGGGGGDALQGVQVLFANGNGDLCGMKADGTGKRIVKAANFGTYDTFSQMAFSADGTKLVYVGACGGQGFLRKVGRDLGAPQDLTTPCGPTATEPAFSPDGTKLAFIASNWTTAERGSYLYVMNADGSNPRRVTSLHGVYNPSERSPSFTRDGSRLVYEDNRTGYTVIASIALDGTGYRTFGGGSGATDPVPTDPTVLRLDDTIFYASAVTTILSGKFNVYRAALDGSGAVRLTDSSSASLLRPKPSPDGKKVLCTRQTGFADQQVLIVDVQTRAVTQLSDTAFSSFDAFPVFVP